MDLTSSNFIDFFDPYFGHCFTFNQAGLLNSSVAGPSHGLELELRVDSADYLPWVDTQAAILSFDIAVRFAFGLLKFNLI